MIGGTLRHAVLRPEVLMLADPESDKPDWWGVGCRQAGEVAGDGGRRGGKGRKTAAGAPAGKMPPVGR
jgi:hypothetical protein